MQNGIHEIKKKNKQKTCIGLATKGLEPNGRERAKSESPYNMTLMQILFYWNSFTHKVYQNCQKKKKAFGERRRLHLFDNDT